MSNINLLESNYDEEEREFGESVYNNANISNKSIRSKISEIPKSNYMGQTFNVIKKKKTKNEKNDEKEYEEKKKKEQFDSFIKDGIKAVYKPAKKKEVIKYVDNEGEYNDFLKKAAGENKNKNIFLNGFNDLIDQVTKYNHLSKNDNKITNLVNKNEKGMGKRILDMSKFPTIITKGDIPLENALNFISKTKYNFNGIDMLFEQATDVSKLLNRKTLYLGDICTSIDAKYIDENFDFLKKKYTEITKKRDENWDKKNINFHFKRKKEINTYLNSILKAKIIEDKNSNLNN